MVLVFKLIGCTINNNTYEIRNNFMGNLNIDTIHRFFNTLNISSNELEHIKFIINSENIKDPNKNYTISRNEEHLVLIFTQDHNIKSKLADIFVKYGNIANTVNEKIETDNEIMQPITEEKKDIIPVLTDEIINNMNKKSIKLFSDPDFNFLIKMYINRPELFNQLAQYVQNGDLIETSFGDEIELNDEQLEQYKYIYDEIVKLNLPVLEDVLKDKIKKYKGHINLIVRSILCENACQ